jgi:hypothetical protein
MALNYIILGFNLIISGDLDKIKPPASGAFNREQQIGLCHLAGNRLNIK